MSIPGFSGPTEVLEHDSPDQITELKIPSGSEWRFEVPFKSILNLKVVDGIGEIFGTELPSGVTLKLSGVKYAVYAPVSPGCTIQYTVSINKNNVNLTSESGEINEYISEESTMSQYANLHFALELLRLEAQANVQKKGPRVLLIGNEASGKTSLAKVLVSYAVKMDRIPLLVNLNPNDGVFSVPGSLTATPISDNLDLETVGGWGGSTTTGATFHNPKQPLVKSFGFTDINQNLDLYKYQVSQLGVVALSRMANDARVRSSGMVIDTPALGFKDVNVVENIISDFEVDIVVLMGNERLTVDLRRKFHHRINKGALNIIKVDKSGGLADVSDTFVRKVQEDTIREYFNGDYKTHLSPLKVDINPDDFTFFKVVKSLEFNSQLAFLPSGDDYAVDEGEESNKKREEKALDMYYTKLDGPDSSNMENSIVAITNVPAPASGKIAPRDLLNATILGYAHVSRVDDTRKKISMLLPFPGQIPHNVLIVTDIGYTE